MSATVIRRLHCDEPACPAVLLAPEDVRTVTQLRTVAYRRFGWSTRSGDHCPQHTRKDGQS